MCQGIVSTNFLDELTITGCAGISYYNEIKWTLLASMTLKSDFDSHKKLKFLVGG
jgi:hypothetical protein